MKSEAMKIKELLEKVEAGTAITLYKTSNNMWFARLQDGTYSKISITISGALERFYSKK